MNRQKILIDRGTMIRALALALAAVAVLSLSFILFCRSRQAGPGPELSESEQLREKIAALGRQEKLLATELSLARNPAPYIAIDVAGRRMELRVQGRNLRSFPIAKISRSGEEAFIAKTWLSIEAKPWETPERARVVPGSGEATSSSIATRDPWGPKRMPADYDLICKDDRALEIRSLPSTQSGNRLTRWFGSGYRQVRDWARDLLGRRNRANREVFEIWLAEDDAQLLFWSLPKQIAILLVNGS
jgi:hypothetical protein